MPNGFNFTSGDFTFTGTNGRTYGFDSNGAPTPVQPLDLTVPNTGGNSGNRFTNWTPSTVNFSSNSGGGSSVTGIPTFNPPGMNIPNVRAQGGGYSGAGSNENTQGGGYSINSNSAGLGKEYHYTEVLGTAGSTARDHNNHCATIAYIIDFCRKQSGHCWGSNALDHPAGGAEGPYHAKAINIGWCDVDDNDMANLFYVLRDFNFNMDIINVSGNKVGDHGVACMINGITGINYQTLYNPTNWQPYKSPNLKVTQSVVKIILSNNKIGDHGAKTISDALASGKLPATKEIDVSGNQITDNGAQSFADALRQGMPTFLQNLKIFGNNLTATGEKALALAVKYSPNEMMAVTLDRVKSSGALDFIKKAFNYYAQEHYENNQAASKAAVAIYGNDDWAHCKKLIADGSRELLSGMIKNSANPLAAQVLQKAPPQVKGFTIGGIFIVSTIETVGAVDIESLGYCISAFNKRYGASSYNDPNQSFFSVELMGNDGEVADAF